MSEKFAIVSFDSMFDFQDFLNEKRERPWQITDPSYQLHSWSMRGRGYVVEALFEKRVEAPFQRFHAIDINK